MKPVTKTLVNSRGEEYDVRPVSDTLITMALNQIEAEFRANGEPLDKPRYRVEIVGGGEQWFDHEEGTLSTDEERSAWAAWKDAADRLEVAREEKRMRMLLEGVQFEIPANGWEDRHRRHKITVPDKTEDPEGYWWHYLTTEVLITPDDLLTAIELCTKATYKGGVKEEAVEAAMQNFRRSILENASRRVEGGTGAVVAQPTDGGSSDG